MSKVFKRVIALELNEISKDAIDQLIARGDCPNFKYINANWQYNKTTSETEYSHIEPWIQWVTIHTGKSFAEHKIFRLSDAETELQCPQTWELLSKNKIESAIVGSMNTTRGDTEGGFYFPDPWTKNGKVYPEQYQALFDLISSKVQTHATGKLTKKELLKAFLICRKFNIPLSLYLKIAVQILLQKLNPKKKWRLAGLFDLLLTYIFRYLLKNTNYGYYTLFLNSVAHYQHHYWRNFDRSLFDTNIESPDCEANDDPVTFGYRIYDEILGKVIQYAHDDPDTLVVVLSAMSQVPFMDKEEEGGMSYYRLNDHHQFAQILGLQCKEVLPMMSRDWQISYENDTLLQADKKRLESLSINSDTLFNITQNTDNTLFVETAITRAVKEHECIDGPDRSYGKFNDFFTRIAIKSGHHTGFGSIWFSSQLPNVSPNREIPLTKVHPLIMGAFGLH